MPWLRAMLPPSPLPPTRSRARPAMSARSRSSAKLAPSKAGPAAASPRTRRSGCRRCANSGKQPKPRWPAGPHAADLLRLLAAVLRREAGLADLVGADHESGQRGRRIRRDVQLVGLERVHGEDVAVRLVARRRADAT